MHALITGGNGFTGKHLAQRLLSKGHEVTILDNRESATNELAEKGAQIIIASVTSAEAMHRATVGIDVVYHLAAAFRQITASQQVYRDVNITGVRNLLEAAEKNGVAKIVHCSTSGVHGGKSGPPWNEDSPIAPSDYYQQTKWEGEQVCQEFIQRGMDITIVRPTSEYGPGDMHGMRFVYKLARNGFFLMFGDGLASVHPIYIDNLLDFFELVTHTPSAKGRTYLAGDENPCTLNELVTAVGKSINKDVKIIHLRVFPLLWIAAAVIELIWKPFKSQPPLFRRRVDWFRKVRGYRIDRAKVELGYKPRVTLQEGLSRTAAWYRESGLL